MFLYVKHYPLTERPIGAVCCPVSVMYNTSPPSIVFVNNSIINTLRGLFCANVCCCFAVPIGTVFFLQCN